MLEKQYDNKFIRSVAEKLVYSKVSLADQENRKLMINNATNALNYLLNEKETDDLFPSDIAIVGDYVNDNLGEAKGLRKIEVSTGRKANFEAAQPKNIYMNLHYLLHDYCQELDENDETSIFLREAIFNIKYMHIHPLEAGNKRSSRIIMAAHLIKQGISPAILTDEDTDMYYEYLNSYDYNSMAKLLKDRSNSNQNLLKKEKTKDR